MYAYLLILLIEIYAFIDYNIYIIKQGTAKGENDVAARRTGNTNITARSG